MSKREIPGKILLAMSGGVDSTVSAALLRRQGYEVHGVFMALGQDDLAEQVARVEEIGRFLQIPVRVLDLETPFKREVLDYFSAAYAQGRTPNPCVVCNPRIKFGRLLNYADSQGIDLMATGHYARIEARPDGRVRLLKGLDPKKDQSYFLCRLRQEQLRRLYFPLGMTAKSKVYEMAKALGVAKLHGTESQDVCFLKDGGLGDFLEARFPEDMSGNIVRADGRVLGRHRGICNYTVGQRRGLGIPHETPYYVIALDAERREVIVGKEAELYRDRLRIARMSWTAGVSPELPGEFTVKIRYRHSGAPARVALEEDGLTCRFQEPQRAVTPGQFAVLYRDDEVIGGGEIEL